MRVSAFALAVAALLSVVSCAAHAGGVPVSHAAGVPVSNAAGEKKSSTPPSKRLPPSAPVQRSPDSPDIPRNIRQFDFARDIGLVEGDRKDSLWLMIADSTLAIGDSLTLVSDDPEPDKDTYVAIISAAVVERLPRNPQEKLHPEAGDFFYRLAAPRGALDCCIFGYAVRVPKSSIRAVAGRAEANLDGDGEPERFQSCSTGDGLQASVWSGEPFRGNRRWTRFYSLGYFVGPNCPGSLIQK